MKKFSLFLIFLIVISNQFVLAQAEEDTKNPILTSKFQLGVGMYIPTQKVKFGLEGNSENQIIDFDETFDFNDSQVRPQVTFDWRFAKKWVLGAEYFNANYANKTTLEKDIEAGDYTFEAGSFVKVGYKINLYRILIGRLISTGDKHELGGGIGFHVLNIGPFIEGEVNISNNGESEDFKFKRVNTSLTAPLPNIALWYNYAFNQKWALSLNADWFGLKVDDMSGSLWDISPKVQYQIIDNLAVSLDYRYFKVNVNVDKEQWNGSVDLSFSGPSLTIIGNL